MTQIVAVLGFTFTFPFYPLFMGEVGIDDPARAALWSGISGWAMGMGLGIFGPVWGVLGDRYGRKRNVIRAISLAGLVLFLTGFSQEVSHLVISRFLVGASSGVLASTMALVASHTPRRRLAYAIGLIQSAIFMANVVGPIVGGVIFDAYGMQAAFFATHHSRCKG